MAIDPRRITDYERSEHELEEFLLFSVVVAGKRSDVQSQKLAAFLASSRAASPFGAVRALARRGALEAAVRRQKLGQYTRIVGAFHAVAHGGVDLATCSAGELEAVPGIGPKTSRFFLLHSRRGARVAALDTHILAWMRSQGYAAPAATPQGSAAYLRLETAFLGLADAAGVSPAEFDLGIWKSRQKRRSR